MSLGNGIYRIWRRRTWVWIPALAFFLVNLALFSTYQWVYAGQVEGLRRDLSGEEERLAALRAEVVERQELLAAARAARSRLEELYSDRLATERDRFTRITAEIRDLARRSGLEPSQMSYPSEEIEDYGLVKRMFTFSVSGTYVELRRFINLLELTPSFVTLEEVALSGEEGNRLRIRLSLSTLFVREESEPLAPLTSVAGSEGVRGAGEDAEDAEAPGGRT